MSASENTSVEVGTSARCGCHMVCGRDEHAAGIGYCILHDPDEEKDRDAFDTAFAEHRDMLKTRRDQARQEEGDEYRPRRDLRDDFRYMVFPRRQDFRGQTFPEEGVDFRGATFSGKALFWKTTFSGEALFSHATFIGTATFLEATFSGTAAFFGATFSDNALFWEATFSDNALFWEATFSSSASFREVTFSGKALFDGAALSDQSAFRQCVFRATASFRSAQFHGRILFAGPDGQRQFSHAYNEDANNEDAASVDFSNAEFHDRSNVRFLDVDLSRASFLHVDVREIEFTSVRWANLDGGNAVYDEVKRKDNGETLPHGALARLYRRLKQAYEDQRDYGRGGDFHFREKEMMRLDPSTATRTRIVLTLYYALSGYGERYWAGGWFVGLILLCSTLSIIAGLDYVATENLQWTLRWRLDDFFRSLVYSVQTAFVRPPEYMTPSNLWGEAVKVGTMILGPLLLGLFGLAIRQRVRR